jgi:hypothetical protein
VKATPGSARPVGLGVFNKPERKVNRNSESIVGSDMYVLHELSYFPKEEEVYNPFITLGFLNG